MSASTESLIRAIQTNDSMAFYGWLHVLTGTPDLDAGVAGDPGITPLAVAVVMYANVLKSDRHQAGGYAAMVAALLDAGANPLVRIGERFVVKRNHFGRLEQRRVADGKTLAEVCEGVLAPAMQAWFARYTVDRMNTELHRHHPAFVQSPRRIAEWA